MLTYYLTLTWGDEPPNTLICCYISNNLLKLKVKQEEHSRIRCANRWIDRDHNRALELEGWDCIDNLHNDKLKASQREDQLQELKRSYISISTAVGRQYCRLTAIEILMYDRLGCSKCSKT